VNEWRDLEPSFADAMNVADSSTINVSSPRNTGSAAVNFTRADLMALTKARLSLMVLITTFIGFWLASSDGIYWMLLVHTLFGTTLTALSSSVFNQLMEIDIDRKMARTADRPLPARRMSAPAAMVIGTLLAAFGILHLVMKVNDGSAMLAALTLFVYVFIYTPMKQRSTFNTIIGAVAGAIPPMIGWVAGGGGYTIEAWFLFGVLFFWQLPHFIAINWMYRDQYKDAGFVMWANTDHSGGKSAALALFFSVCITVLLAVPYFFGFANIVSLIGGVILGGVMIAMAVNFGKQRTRPSARKLFFYTLIYLPLVLALLVITWTN
jgi:protoheme IX farnesyltransferase